MSKRPRGLLTTWQPRVATVQRLEQVNMVLEEYRDHWPLTIWQVFYRLVGAHGYEKTEQAYDNLAKLFNKARRAGLVDWAAIRDDGITREGGRGPASKEVQIDAWRAQASYFRLNRQLGQPIELYLWCEAAGMAPQLERATEAYDVPVISGGGFNSTTAKHDLALEFMDYRRVVVLHVGDRDPSGVHVFQNLAEDIGAFMNGSSTELEFVRLAVTPEQVESYDLPTAPPKATARRRFEGETTQAEALPPDLLAEIVLRAVMTRVDHELRAEVLVRERRISAELVEMLA